MVDEFHFDMPFIQPLNASDGSITTEVITRIRVPLWKCSPHLVRLVVTGERDLVVGVIIIRTPVKANSLFLAPLQYSVGVLIVHTISIMAIGGHCNRNPIFLPRPCSAVRRGLPGAPIDRFGTWNQPLQRRPWCRSCCLSVASFAIRLRKTGRCQSRAQAPEGSYG